MNATTPIRDGEVIAGKYRVERTIGRGGMGFVVAATHLQLDQLVALKFLTTGLFDSTEATQRFLLEARTTFRLRSEHTVRMLDVGTLTEGQAFIVMELLEGQDLRQVIAASGPLSEADAARYVVQACSALEEAHALGIVHRDLKPSNLFVTKNAQGTPLVKVLDFGISKVDEPGENVPLSRPESPLGTPRYMAPEQWRAGAVDARTDIYALGLTLYELLTGNVPLHGLPPDERRSRLLAGAIPSPRTLRPALREAICKVTLRCLQTVPDGRYPSATHLASALKDAVPTAAPRPPRASLTTTATTLVVPDEVLARDAALAFADVTATQVDPPALDVAAASTRHEFAGAPLAPKRPPPAERLKMAPLRGKMVTPTLAEGSEPLAAAPVAPAPPPAVFDATPPLVTPPLAPQPLAPSPPIEPMRPRMLTPTQNDPPPRATLNAKYAPDWHPSASAPPPPIEAPVVEVHAPVAPMPIAPPPAIVHVATPPVMPYPVAIVSQPPPPRSSSRVVVAIVVAVLVGVAAAVGVLAYLVRR